MQPSRVGKGVRTDSKPDSARVSRRSFVAAAGAVAVSGLAGCTSESSSSTTMNIAYPPFGPTQLVFDTIREQGWLEDLMDDAGYEVEIQETWDDPTLFAAGQTDMGVVGPYEAGLIGDEQGVSTVLLGNLLRTDTVWYTYPESGYTLDETGGVQESLDALAEDNAQVAIGGWSGGDIPLVQLIFEAFYGHNFSENDTDFEIVTMDYYTLAQSTSEEEVQASYGAPTYGSIPYFLDDNGTAMEEPNLLPIFTVANEVLDQGFAVPPLEGIAVREDVYNEHPEAGVAYHDAIERGLEYVFNNTEEMKNDEELMETVGVADTMAQHEFWVDWTLEGDISGYGLDEDQWSLDVQPLFETPYQQDEIDNQAETLDTLAAETDLVPDNWSDFVTYEDV